MKWWLICLMLIGPQLFAQTDNCSHLKELDSLEELHDHLKWHGANDKQIEEAPCKTLSPPGEKEIQKLIEQTNESPIEDTVHNVKLNDSPRLLEAFRQFTTAKIPLGVITEPEKQIDIQDKYQINPECHKVVCAVEKIWGKNSGKKLLYLYLKHNYVGSELAFGESSRFTDEELDDVLMGMEDLPDHFTPLGREGQRLTHYTRGRNRGSSLTKANAVVMLFDGWTEEPRRERQYSIFHEMSHNIASKLQNIDVENPDWLKLTGWIKTGNEWKADSKGCHASEYAATNPSEDWAETLSTYRYNGRFLKKRCPEKYAFVQSHVFKGIEYTDVGSCSPISPAKLENVRKELINQLSQSQDLESLSPREVHQFCQGTFKSYPPKREELVLCAAKAKSNLLNAALMKEEVPTTSANQDLILSGLSDSLKQDTSTLNALASKLNHIEQTAIEEAELSLKKAATLKPEKAFTAFDVKRYDFIRECHVFLLNGNQQKFKDCEVDAILRSELRLQEFDGGNFPQYKMASLYSPSANEDLRQKWLSRLKETIAKDPVITTAMHEAVIGFASDLNAHSYYIKDQIRKNKDLLLLPPKEFCAQTYGTGNHYVSQYGYDEGVVIPKIYDWCVDQQSKKKNRELFRPAEWEEMVRNLIN